MPRAGRVVALRYLPGRFVNARREDAARINEQLWMDLVEPGGRRVRVIQISGALARRLVCWARLGEELGAGERYGLIKYGSRCDILLPAAEPRELAVAIGDKVNAGRSILLRFTKAHGETSGN
jgi:phosphatidylserine decarboxylase